MTKRVSFEYRNNNGETVFETFLKYTDEKRKSAAVLRGILRRILAKRKKKIIFLDIGAGNGEYLRSALQRVERLDRTEFTLIEPNDDLVNQLRLTVDALFPGSTVKVVRSTFENFTADCQFDIILASHVPLANDKIDKLSEVFEKMLGLLNSEGHLILVLRKKDDVHKFRAGFKSKLTGKDYTALTIDDAVEVLNELAKDMPLRISMFTSKSELHLPIADNMQDVISIIEFLLNKKWEEFPADVRSEVLDYIGRRNGILHQVDGFAVIWKGHFNS